MVNIGFICEGYTELFILESDTFKNLLNELGLHSVGVINVQGNGNLLPHNIKSHRENLFNKGASVIFILTDLDQEQCITKTRLRITESENQIIIVAVKQIEAWFLADYIAMNTIFKGDYSFEFPENEDIPFETIRTKYFEKFRRGLVGRDEKKRLAQKMINARFSIQNAAEHPNCPSAKYFLTKLTQCASTNPVE
ncbi:hypothetical protein VB776_10555 [Arcicella sp. DC2W]|uniref:DUF4276 family protein n=1 Tax=Arcicella gelida TaxID=2984195 RepID=A0ABU5S4G0_9BACT|nr:hypothetical protein [Arcicella sp. DC2W]MEA5403358.1 hypothetical protein [Arcicella sp. DC2W]